MRAITYTGYDCHGYFRVVIFGYTRADVVGQAEYGRVNGSQIRNTRNLFTLVEEFVITQPTILAPLKRNPFALHSC